MKVTKYLLGIGFAMVTLFTSCEQDNMGAQYNLETMGVTFATSSQKVTFPAYDYEGFDVEVIRAKSADAATINLQAGLLDSNNDLNPLPAEFKVPATVTFAAGESITKIHVTVGDITSGTDYKVYIAITDENVAPIDANMEKVITVFRDYTYSAIGTGTIISTFFEFEDNFEWEKADQTSWYKALSPYEEGYDIIFKVGTDGKSVTIDKQVIAGDISGYGKGYVAGKGEIKNGAIVATLEFTVSAGSFGSAKETFVLPDMAEE